MAPPTNPPSVISSRLDRISRLPIAARIVPSSGGTPSSRCPASDSDSAIIDTTAAVATAQLRNGAASPNRCTSTPANAGPTIPASPAVVIVNDSARACSAPAASASHATPGHPQRPERDPEQRARRQQHPVAIGQRLADVGHRHPAHRDQRHRPRAVAVAEQRRRDRGQQDREAGRRQQHPRLQLGQVEPVAVGRHQRHQRRPHHLADEDCEVDQDRGATHASRIAQTAARGRRSVA